MTISATESSTIATYIPGYPRVGTGRVYKFLLEKYWSGILSESEFEAQLRVHRQERLLTQANAGLDFVPVGDFSAYDHVLDCAFNYGVIPTRFQGLSGQSAYFASARGYNGQPALEMTKWFDTNYHYLVPEIHEDFKFSLNLDRATSAFKEAQQLIGSKARPVTLSPFTFLWLARLRGKALKERLNELIPLFRTLLSELLVLGADTVLVDESALACDLNDDEFDALKALYKEINLPVTVQVAYNDVEPYWAELKELPVRGFALDFVRGLEGNLRALKAHGFNSRHVLGAGVVDGRNIWISDIDKKVSLVQDLIALGPAKIEIGASCTLLHLAETIETEKNIDESIGVGICFARERIRELRIISSALHGHESEDFHVWRAKLTQWQNNTDRVLSHVRAREESLSEKDLVRRPFAERFELQKKKLNLPPLPTTTIGSFPQTTELRKARASRTTDPAAYEEAIKNEIKSVIALQEEIGLDVLVHGEPERNDMVQFFGDQLRGFVTTTEGWVQSYGSRCVRPPIIYGDIERLHPLSVKEVAYAQSLTEKPVKGMLTGPITIIQWSYVRDDIPRANVAQQIALALRDEVKDLEDNGIFIVQIDEAAYREGLPLRLADRPAYIDWAIRAFRICSSGCNDDTQIHTHMCYSDFGDMMEAIAAMDADVISIEDSRSNGDLVNTLRTFTYNKSIGPGVYDIHSPNIPTVEQIIERITFLLEVVPTERLWVNPDCGLKTRRYEEVIPSLRSLVEAAAVQRKKVST